METILKLLMKNPDMLKNTVSTYIDKYKPVAYSILNEIVDIYDDYANNKKFFGIIAKAKKNQYDAYISEGFSEDQATAFLINDNIQLMKNIKSASNHKSVTKNEN